MIIYIILIFSLSLISCADVEEWLDNCDYNQDLQIEKCMEPMIFLAGQLNSLHDFKTSEAGRRTLDKICELYKTFHDCSNDIRCNSSSLRAVEASYGYMCTKGYKKFSENVQCFTRVESSPVYEKCKTLASRALEIPFTGSVELSFDEKTLGQLCTAMKSYLRCSKTALLDVCDESAWQLVSKITMESIRITMPSCDIDQIN